MRNKFIDEILKKSAGTISNSIKTINKESLEKARRNNNGNVNNKAYKSANNVAGAIKSGVKSAFNNINISNGNSGLSINTKDYANSDFKNSGLNNGTTQFKDNNIKPFNQMGFENYYNIQKQKEQKEQKQKEAINKSVADIYKQSYNYINKGLQNSAKILKQKSAPIYSKSGLNGNMYNSTNNDKKVNTDSIVYKGDNNLKSKVYTQNSNVNKDFMTYQNTYTQNKKLGMDFINQNNNKTYIKSYDPKTIREPEEKKNNNVRPYGNYTSDITTDIYRNKFGPGSEYYTKRIEDRNKRHEQFAPVLNNAKPMNSTKTYSEINSVPRRPGDFTKENSTNMYYEHVIKPKIQSEANMQKSAFQENLHNSIEYTKDAPRYGDFSKRKYYAEDGSAIDPFIDPKEGEETKDLLIEDYGEPVAVEYMLEKKGAENLDFSNTEALKENPYLKDVDISLMQSMTEEERKMLYVAMSDYMGNSDYDREMRDKIPYAMSLVVSDRVKEETLANIEKYGNDYLIKIAYEETLYRDFEGLFQTGSVMGTNFNPSYRRGQSVALEYLKDNGTGLQKAIIYVMEGFADVTVDTCIDSLTIRFPWLGKMLSYSIAWGKTYNDAMNYEGVYDVNKAQSMAFEDANDGLLFSINPDVEEVLRQNNISINIDDLINGIEDPRIKQFIKKHGKDIFNSAKYNIFNKSLEYRENEDEN